MIQKTFFISLIIGFASLITSLSASKPNLVIFLTDDQGWGDVSYNGNTNLSTPNIDTIATEGTVLDRFFVCRVCAPTRAEFMTGRYYPRTGTIGVSTGQERLNEDEVTIFKTFKSAGYTTGAFGKWHNGTQPPLHPNNRGIDEFYGFTHGHWGHYFDAPMDHNGKRVKGKGFMVDDLTTRAIRFIEKNKNNPFLCYLPYNTPHSPMQVPDEFFKKFDGKQLGMMNRSPEDEDIPKTRAALAMCENIDWNVGRVLKKIDDLSLADNTIILFFCDNGPNSVRWNGDMKGKKGSIDEGGVRSPFFIRWPGNIPAGKTVKEIGSAVDLLPTLSDLAGIPMISKKTLDGISIKKLITGKAKNWPDRTIYNIQGAKKGNQAGVSLRTNDYRLDAFGKLYEIASDPGQRNDISKKHPELTEKLKKLQKQMADEMAPLFAASRLRPFHVGYGPLTDLPARDGIAHGGIQRSDRAPNHSFFTNWTSIEDKITWTVNVAEAGDYKACVYYACKKENVGCSIKLSSNHGDSTSKTVKKAFDPPLVGQSFDRVERKSESFVKDFKVLKLGTIALKKGNDTLTLSAPKITGDAAIDVLAIEMERL